jgi:hypothetical protein
MDEAAYSKASISVEKVSRLARTMAAELITLLTIECRYEIDVKEYEDAVKKMQFKKEAKNLFSAPKSKPESGIDLKQNDLLKPPIRPTLKLIPSWESVLCTLEARLLAEFNKLEKW